MGPARRGSIGDAAVGARSRGRRRVRHRSLGRLLRGAHQPRRRGLPGDDRTARCARRMDRAGGARGGATDHGHRAVRHPPGGARVGAGPATPACAPTRRHHRGDRPRRGAPRTRARRQPRMGRAHIAVCVPVAHHAGVALRARPRHRRAHVAEADPHPERRPHAVRRHTRMGHRTRRHASAGRHHAPRRHRCRRHGPVHGLRLRQLRGVDGTVVRGRPHLAARSRVGVGARASARRRRARPAVVHRRQAAREAEHLHRHDRVGGAPRGSGLGCARARRHPRR